MAQAQICSSMEILILVSTSTVDRMARANTLGSMELSISVISYQAWSMAKANGEAVVVHNQIVMKETISMIVSVDSGSSFGQVATSIRENTRMMNVMATGKFTGQMAAVTRVNGLGESNMAMEEWFSLMAT